MNNNTNTSAFSIWDNPNEIQAPSGELPIPDYNNSSIFNDYSSLNQQGVDSGLGTDYQFDLNAGGSSNQIGSIWDNPNLFNNIGKGIAGVGAVANTVLGYQQLNQSKDQLKFNQQAFWANYDQQASLLADARSRQAKATGQ